MRYSLYTTHRRQTLDSTPWERIVCLKKLSVLLSKTTVQFNWLYRKRIWSNLTWTNLICTRRSLSECSVTICNRPTSSITFDQKCPPLTQMFSSWPSLLIWSLMCTRPQSWLKTSTRVNTHAWIKHSRPMPRWKRIRSQTQSLRKLWHRLARRTLATISLTIYSFRNKLTPFAPKFANMAWVMLKIKLQPLPSDSFH